MLTKYFNENDFLEGNYPLQIRNRLVKPEEFLELFENKRYYEDVRKFIRRVDISTVEIISSERVKEILFRKNSNIDVMEEIKLTELDLTYPAIGFWRDQIKLNEAKIIQNLINIAD